MAKLVAAHSTSSMATPVIMILYSAILQSHMWCFSLLPYKCVCLGSIPAWHFKFNPFFGDSVNTKLRKNHAIENTESILCCQGLILSHVHCISRPACINYDMFMQY